MSDLRRTKINAAWYFFTVLTHRRRSFLTDDFARRILKEAFCRIKSDRPFDMPVFCLLPNHLHCIWKMPEGDCDYSTRWALIKRAFSRAYIAAGGTEAVQTESRHKKRELGIWQRRFWEHRIRDRDDYWNHLHYIHYNPVKHGLVDRIADWPYSTYHRFSKQGLYKDFDWSLFKADEYDEQMECNE
jgi:putative transposase